MCWRQLFRFRSNFTSASAGDVLDYLSGAGGNEVLLGAPD
jgi:hypothetical protein